MLSRGKKRLKEKENLNLQENIEFMEHDFFKPQPRPADVFLLNKVLELQTDADCVRLIRAMIPAMRDGTKVVMNSVMIPNPTSERSALLGDKHFRYVPFLLPWCF